MGLLDYLTQDPNKQESLRAGLLNAGINMLASQSPNLGTALGVGAGAGISAYQKEFDDHKKKLAQTQAMQAAMTPERAATPTMYGIKGLPQRFNTEADARAASSPYKTTIPTLAPKPLMPGLDAAMNGELGASSAPMSPQTDVQMPEQQVETYPGQAAQAGGFDFGKMAQGIISNPDSPPDMVDLAMKYYASQKPAAPAEAYSLSPGQVRFGADNKQLAAVPAAPKEGSNPYGQDMREYLAVNGIDPATATPQQLRAAYDATNSQKDRRVPKTSIVNNVTQKTGDSLAKEVGPMMAASTAAADAARAQYDTANRIDDALKSGKVIVGPMANARLGMAQVGQLLGIGGKDAAETITNTRTTIQGLANFALTGRAALKGQGQISDYEGKLLKAASSGDIQDLTVPEIKVMTGVAKRVAFAQQADHKRKMAVMRSKPGLTDVADFYDVPSLPEPAAPAVKTMTALPTKAPASVDAKLWAHMTPEERKLWK